MTERKLGDKTLRLLDKRMRLVPFTGQDCSWNYRSGEWDLRVEFICATYDADMIHNDKRFTFKVTARPTAEAAISECENQALALFKQLGELCGKRGRE